MAAVHSLVFGLVRTSRVQLSGTAGGALLYVILSAGAAVPLESQVVEGAVVNEDSRDGIEDVRLTLVDKDGRSVAETTSGPGGAFRVGVGQEGVYAVKTDHIAYEGLEETIELELDAVVEVEIELARDAVPLNALEVVAERYDALHEGTHEGFYQRHARGPVVGARDVLFRRGFDEELDRITSVQEFLKEHGHPRFRHNPGFMGPRGYDGLQCGVAVFADGEWMRGQDVVAPLQTPVAELQGIEYYRDLHEAPADLRPGASPGRYGCGVVAIWR